AGSTPAGAAFVRPCYPVCYLSAANEAWSQVSVIQAAQLSVGAPGGPHVLVLARWRDMRMNVPVAESPRSCTRSTRTTRLRSKPMLNEDLKGLFARRPFRPFTIHLACGQAVLVDQPERMSISPDETRMNVFTADGHFSSARRFANCRPGSCMMPARQRKLFS